MSEYMDTNVEPCDDFYQYACGSYLKNNKIPDHKYRLNTGFEKIGDKIKSQVNTDFRFCLSKHNFSMKLLLCQLKVMLEEPVDEEEPMPYKMAKWAYKACMDDAELEVSQPSSNTQ